jgi:hypothetical protein
MSPDDVAEAVFCGVKVGNRDKCSLESSSSHHFGRDGGDV